MAKQRPTKAHSELRRRAEAELAGEGAPLGNVSPEEMSTLLHELHTHQIELELQNEELRKAQTELAESRDQYASLYDFAPVGYATVSSKGILQQVNLQLTEKLGVPRSKVLGHPLSEFVVPEDQDPYYRHWHETPDSAGASTCEVRMKGPEGEVFWAEIKRVPDPSPEETEGAFLCAISDITKRKRAERALFASEQHFRAIFEQSGDGIMILDPNTADGIPVIVDANEAACRVHGYSRDDFIGRPVSDLDDEEGKRLCRERTKLIVSGKPLRVVNTHVRSDGTTFPMSIRADRVDIEGEPSLILTTERDITEHTQLETRLRQTEKMEAIGQLAGGVAHDFNNQLAGIMNYADLLLSETKDGEQHTYIDAIIRSCKRGKNLIGQLLAFSRKGMYQMVPVNIHLKIAGVVAMLEPSSDRRIAIRQRLDANPPMTTGDPSQLQNALLNLGLNARDAMPDGGELVLATDVVMLYDEHCSKSTFDLAPGEYLKITVTDSGIGMDEETRSKIFEPFFTTKEEGRGTGMGLASVYGTIVNHKGAIDVDSKVGQGTTMTIFLPLSHQEAAQGAVEAPGPSLDAESSARILMVDDEKSVRESTAALLRNKGYKVVTAKDGGEAVAYYEKSWQHIDLVILDMNMPALNGRDTFVAMRKINPDIKALLATGYSLDSNAQEILDEGALSHIQKPFRVHDLVPQIEQALNG